MVRIVGVIACFLVLVFEPKTMAEQPKAYLDMDPGFFSGRPTVVVNGKELSTLPFHII